MATSTNSEKQCRLVLLLTKAGGETLRELVMNSVAASGLSLNDFLKAHQYRITHMPGGRERQIRFAKDVLFPQDGSRTDINKWELNVLCFIVLEICILVGNLHSNIIDNVEDLKSMRNKVYHAADMTNDEYDQCATRIEHIVLTCCRKLNNGALLTRVNAIVKSIKDDPLSFRECERILMAWNNMQWEVTERLIALSDDHKVLLADHKEIHTKLDAILQNQKHVCPNQTQPGLQLEIQIKDSQKEGEVAAILVEMINTFKEHYDQQRVIGQPSERSTQVKISSPDDEQNEDHKLSEATGVNTIVQEGNSPEEATNANVSVQLRNTTESKEHKMAYVKQQLELVLNDFCIDETVIIKCYEGSVHLIVQCSSFPHLMNKITECLEGKTTKLFNPVQAALRHIEGCEHIRLDVILIQTSYWECIKQIVECVEENLDEALQTVDNNAENKPPAPEDESEHAKLYISVKSTASCSTLEDIRKRCCSDEMKQKIAGLTEALKSHLEIENLALEMKVHKVSLQDSDEGVIVSSSSTRDDVSESAPSPRVYTSAALTSTPAVTVTPTQSHPSFMKSDLRPVRIKKEVSIPFDLQTYSTGIGRPNLNWLVDTLNVNINIPPQKEASNIIQVTGTPADVQRTEVMLAKTNVFKVDLKIYPKTFPHWIERKIQRIGRKHEVGYQLPERNGEDQGTMTIIGLEENCKAAREEILQLAQTHDLVSITKEMSVPFDIYKYRIHYDEPYLDWLMNEFDVDINVTSQKKASNIIQVTGTPANIQRAELALARTQVVTVDLDIYPWISVWDIEVGMSRISYKYKVGYQLPEKWDKVQDTITIIGYEEDCKAACEKILQVPRHYVMFERDDIDEETLEQLHNPPSKKQQPLSTRSKDDKGFGIKYPSSQSSEKPHAQFGIGTLTSSQVKLPIVPTTDPAEKTSAITMKTKQT